MAVSEKILAMIKAKKAVLKDGKIVTNEDDENEDESDDDDDMKTKRMRDRLKKMKGKLPTGSATRSDVKPKAMKDNS